jgi:hypothetical protein
MRAGDGATSVSDAPNLPRAVTNMKHPDFARLNRPKNEVGVSTNRHASDCASCRRMTDVGVPPDYADSAFNCELNVESAPRAALVEVA